MTIEDIMINDYSELRGSVEVSVARRKNINDRYSKIIKLKIKMIGGFKLFKVFFLTKKIEQFNRLEQANVREWAHHTNVALDGFKKLHKIQSNLIEFYDNKIEETAIGFGIEGVRGPEDLLDLPDIHEYNFDDDKENSKIE